MNELLASQKCNGKSRLACADVRHPLSSKTPMGILSWTYWMTESREMTKQMTGRQLYKACPPSSHTHTLKQPPPPHLSITFHALSRARTHTHAQSLTLPLPLALSRILSISCSHTDIPIPLTPFMNWAKTKGASLILLTQNRQPFLVSV